MDLGNLARNPWVTVPLSVALRAGLISFGDWQDRNSPVKYTDIDYYVFTDAARSVSQHRSPYERDTYRYTPLLAWLLVPTAWSSSMFNFGKVLFAASDILCGLLIITILSSSYGMPVSRATAYANIWLLNPMVAQISTRGSSEGFLLMLIVLLLWATLRRCYTTAGVLLGLCVHLKIYPFIYGASIIWWLDATKTSQAKAIGQSLGRAQSIMGQLRAFGTVPRGQVLGWSLATFTLLNLWMFRLYGIEFIEHTYLYHVVRSDHRHNFSPYNMLLYLNASSKSNQSLGIEKFAFVPQLVLGVFVLPISLAKRNLAATMMLQTFTFVTFNKVCTSQYFLWYMVFLPFYLPDSILLRDRNIGVTALVAWIAGQALWLHQGYRLEFLGISSFFPGMLVASLAFFIVNIWILGVMIQDIRCNA